MMRVTVPRVKIVRRSYIMLVLAAFCLQGCIAVPFVDGVDEALQYTRERIYSLSGRDIRRGDRVPLAAYCYRTLAQVDCYHTPQPGQESRLVATGNLMSVPYSALPLEVQRVETVAVAPVAVSSSSEAMSQNQADAMAPKTVKMAFTPIPRPKPSEEERNPLPLIEFKVGDKQFSTHNLPEQDDLLYKPCKDDIVGDC